MSRLAGWFAIGMALFALGPSVVPGAFSLFGLMFSMLALIFSLFPIKRHGQRYFHATAVIVAANVLLMNDALRIWKPLPMPLPVRLALYGLVLFAVTLCALIACRLAHAKNGPHETGSASSPSSRLR